MGASSSKRTFFWQKKKSPLERAWGRLKGALPHKKRRRKSILEKLKPGNLKENKSKKRFSLTDKKQPELLKRFSLGNVTKGERESRGKGNEKRGSRRQSRAKDEKNKEAPLHQEESGQRDGKKTGKSESKGPKVAWKLK